MKKTSVKNKPIINIIDEDNLISSQFGVEQQNRVNKGKKYETSVDDKLLMERIICKKLSITVYEHGIDHTCIADHFYIGKTGIYWMESTIILDENHADRLNTKLRRVKQFRKDVTDFVIFFEKNPDQKSRNNIQRYKKILEAGGWTVCINGEETSKYIKNLGKIEGNPDKIKIANSINIPINKLVYHPSNRKIDEARCRELAKSIVKEGFISQLNVVPEWKRGRFTGKYVVFEGNHRLHAVIEFCIKEWGFAIDELPCVLVDWIKSDDKVKVHELLILVNTTQKPWGMPDYVISHLKEAKERNQKHKEYSYDKLDWLYRITKKTQIDNVVNKDFKDSRFFYIFGPVDFDNAKIGKTIDRDIVKIGEYRISETEFENIMKPFVMNVAMPFVKWFDVNLKNWDKKVGDVFLKYLYHEYKLQRYTMKDIHKLIDGFKLLGDKTPVQVKKEPWDAMWETLEKML